MSIPFLATTFLATALAAVSVQDPTPAKPAPPPPTTAPEVGQAAPSFRLNDHAGHGVSVGGARDTWTILAFYPMAATPG